MWHAYLETVVSTHVCMNYHSVLRRAWRWLLHIAVCVLLSAQLQNPTVHCEWYVTFLCLCILKLHVYYLRAIFYLTLDLIFSFSYSEDTLSLPFPQFVYLVPCGSSLIPISNFHISFHNHSSMHLPSLLMRHLVCDACSLYVLFVNTRTHWAKFDI